MLEASEVVDLVIPLVVLAAALGGSIGVASAPGEGSTLTVKIPQHPTVG